MKITARDDFKNAAIAAMTSFHQEHNPDDTHSIIHATGAIFERNRGALTTAAPQRKAMGETIKVFYNPADFTGNGTMTWTVTAGGLTKFAYFLIGPRMFVDFVIGSSTIGGALNTRLGIRIPDGYYCADLSYNPCRIVDNAVAAMGIALVTPGAVGTGNIIQIFRNDVAAWTATPVVQGQINFEIRTA